MSSFQRVWRPRYAVAASPSQPPAIEPTRPSSLPSSAWIRPLTSVMWFESIRMSAAVTLN